MRLLREYIRGLLIEATEYDDHFARILDSHAPVQAIELAKSLDIPLRELPWNLERIRNYISVRIEDWSDEELREQGVIPIREEIMEEIGISKDEYFQMINKDQHETSS
jgi:hypothetical protein